MAATAEDAELDAITARYAPKVAAKSSTPEDVELDTIAQRYAPKPKKEVPAWIKQTLAEPDPDEPAPGGPAQIRPEGRYNLHTKQWEASKPVKAAFTDQGTMTAQQLRAIEDDKLSRGRAALAGGTLRGLTFDLGDEAAGVVAGAKAITEGESPVKAYRKTRDEVRKATKESEEWDPSAAAKGQLIGTAATVPLGIGAPKGASLLTAGNTLRAAGVGGLVGLGGSEADLTKGEVGGAAWDTAKGAAVGAGANTALGLLGKAATGVKNFVRGAPERVAEKADNALIDAATLGAPASQRDALMGELGLERPQALALIKSNPALEKAIREGRKADAAMIVKSMREGMGAEDAAFMGELDKQKQIDVTPIVTKIEARAKALEASPSVENQAEAAALRKRAEVIREKYMPEPAPKTPEGGELLKTLVGKAQKYDVDRAAHGADDFLGVAKKYDLAKVANDPPARLSAIDKTVEKLNNANDGIYNQAAKKKPIYVANLTGTLHDHADTLRRQYGSGSLPDAIDGFASGLSKTASNRRETTITPRELRNLISEQQGKAFSGSFANPTDAKEAWQDVTKVMRGFLEDHVEKSAGAGALKMLKQNNREISVLLPFRSSAEEEVAAARLLPDKLPETRTGFVPPSAVREMANSTRNPEVGRDITGELYGQTGTDAAHRMASLDDRAALMSRIEEPLSHISAREASPPTTLRSHAKSLSHAIESTGTTGALAVGATTTVAGAPHVGVPIMVGAIAAKYGKAVGGAAERAAVSMEYALRKGAQRSDLATIAKIAGLPPSVASDLVESIAPQTAARAVTKGKEE